MARHFVIMSSSYTEGKRIALDYSKPEQLDSEFLKEKIKKIKEHCGEDVSISTHFVETETEDWKSLEKADSFFKDVYVTKNITDFIRLIMKDRVLQGIDVARYILSQIKCTHLKLEKLVYLCYAEYLIQEKEKLFVDNIYAFKFGPVVETVYEKYKQFGNEELDDTNLVSNNNIMEMPTVSRILFARMGLKKMLYIDKTIEKYGKYTASQLVEITHKKDTPWDKTFIGENYTPIDDKTILKYHKNER